MISSSVTLDPQRGPQAAAQTRKLKLNRQLN